MAWRVIVRLGLTQDTGSIVRNGALVPELQAMGLHNTATGTWEASFTTEALAAARLSNVLAVVARPAAIKGADPAVRLKHLWVYLGDQPDPAVSQEEV